MAEPNVRNRLLSSIKTLHLRADGFAGIARNIVPGLLVAGVIALASQFISEHYGAPAMLLALLIGMALNFLSSDPRCKPGISFGGRELLRLGVALLGLRISVDMVSALGWQIVALVVLGVLLTIAFGFLASRVVGLSYRFGFLTAGSVAICGASAAIAIAATLPKEKKSEEHLAFTVVGVTILSTFAMILYPVLSAAMGFDDRAAGIYLGATIHDVAQVVGAGFSVSEEAGETATLVKLLRVAMLAPIVTVALLVFRARGAADADGAVRAPLIPGFVLGFLLLATVNSLFNLPVVLTETTASISRWLLLLAIAAVGLNTVPKELMKVGRMAVGLILAETLFLAVLMAGALLFIL